MGKRKLRVAGPSRWLEPGMRKLVAKQFERHSVLQADGEGLRKAAD
jgi:hypothetical protein